MGYRLEGPTIEHKNGADIVSDGTPFGAVQVTGEGLPIVLLADRGTTGGYTKIGTVISVDLAGIAQAQTDDTVTFCSVSLKEAHQALKKQERIIQELRNRPKSL
jgi:allophanate hydrolase subunit 2